jgi:4-hydroxy-tetrahydrodipicolinate synthase
MKSLGLKGIIVPLVTPFDNRGEIDLAATRDLVQFLIERGVHGLFPGGTTGEWTLLTLKERHKLAEVVVDAADGRVPVLVHTGTLTTRDTLTLTRHARSIGAQAAAIVTPFYLHLTDEALAGYFEQIANDVPEYPIYLYNIPQLTGRNISLSLIRRLVENCPNIVGMKDSSGSLSTLVASAPLRDGDFNTAIGADGLTLAGVAVGIDAFISGNANVVPELIVALYEAASSGDLILARELQRQLDTVRQLLGDGSNYSLFKGILAQRGIAVGQVRAPLLQSPEAIIQERWRELSALVLKG